MAAVLVSDDGVPDVRVGEYDTTHKEEEMNRPTLAQLVENHNRLYRNMGVIRDTTKAERDSAWQEIEARMQEQQKEA